MIYFFKEGDEIEGAKVHLSGNDVFLIYPNGRNEKLISGLVTEKNKKIKIENKKIKLIDEGIGTNG